MKLILRIGQGLLLFSCLSGNILAWMNSASLGMIASFFTGLALIGVYGLFKANEIVL